MNTVWCRTLASRGFDDMVVDGVSGARMGLDPIGRVAAAAQEAGGRPRRHPAASSERVRRPPSIRQARQTGINSCCTPTALHSAFAKPCSCTQRKESLQEVASTRASRTGVIAHGWGLVKNPEAQFKMLKVVISLIQFKIKRVSRRAKNSEGSLGQSLRREGEQVAAWLAVESASCLSSRLASRLPSVS